MALHVIGGNAALRSISERSGHDAGIRPLRVMIAALHHSSAVIRLIGKEADACPA
jgi:hypothetical protein